MRVEYGYTDRDLLAEPESYEYSEVHGPAFLEAYRGNRAGAIERLAGGELPERLAGLLAGSAEAPLSVEDLAGEGPLETVGVLETLVAWGPVPEGGQRGEVAGAWLDGLVGRFEVTKGLAGAYDGRPRAVGEAPAPLIAYPLLAWACSAAYGAGGNLKMLNALLKIDDMLVSQEGLEGEVAGLTVRCLEAEVGHVVRLGRDRGVEV